MQFGVSESIAHWGKYRPDAPAVYHNGLVTSYRDLNSLVNKICSKINVAQLGTNRIAIAAKSRFELLIALLAVLRVGKSAVFLNVGLPSDALQVNLTDTGVSALIHDDHYGRIKGLLGADSNWALNISNLLTSSSSSNVFDPTVIQQPDDEWGVLFSSGTTGIPKGIERDHNSIVTELLGWCLELGLSRQSTFYIGRPIYYTGGLVLTLSTLLIAGQVFLDDFRDDNDPSEVWANYQEICHSHKLSWAFFIPDQIRAFTRFGESLSDALSGAETLLVMGGPISGEEKIKASRVLRSGIIESWGNTESLGTITDQEDLEKRPKSIGRPFLTDELCIIDDAYRQVGPNQDGRIAGNEEAGFFQYSNRPEATSRAKRNDLIISEDIGYVDDDGYFYVRGRQQDCVVINGETLFIPDIENKIREHQNIQECGLVAKQLDEVAINFIAFVVLLPGESISESELLQQLNSTLSQNEQLTEVRLITSLPRLPSGKIDRIVIGNFLNKQE